MDELMRIVSETPSAPYRLQFLAAGTGREPSILKEVDLRASDPSGAVREAARGIHRHPGRRVEPDAFSSLARDRQSDAAPVAGDFAGTRLALPEARLGIGAIAEVTDQRLGLGFDALATVRSGLR